MAQPLADRRRAHSIIHSIINEFRRVGMPQLMQGRSETTHQPRRFPPPEARPERLDV